MIDKNPGQPHAILREIAHRVMIANGLDPDFSSQALAELAHIKAAAPAGKSLRDLRSLLWCSIDNDDSRDLDQLSVAAALPDGAVKILIAIADVDALVRQSSALDQHARQNTTSVYTAAAIFPMLPERLSTDLTSLGFGAERLAIVIEMTVAKDGTLTQSDIYQAQVKNRAKLAYDSVAAWLEGTGPIPPAVQAVPGLEENLRLQDHVAQQLRGLRFTQGALYLETTQARPVFADGELKDLALETRNRAKDIIEDFMIAANGVSARFLAARKFPSVRRVVRTPRKWDRIVALAAESHFTLPATPDSKALQEFLLASKAADPDKFADLSLCVIKLMGRGEYVLELPGGDVTGHFGLAVRDYSHSTAPNRRFPDLITQRLLKAALAKGPLPYSTDELAALAQHCTQEEDAAKKVERHVAKSAAALLLAPRIGSKFTAIVTAVADKGTWLRLSHPPVEGKLVSGFEGREVGNVIQVRLVHADVQHGYVDFAAI